MELRKTLIHMLHNPVSLLIYFLIYGVIASTLATISDESFIYGFLPDFYSDDMTVTGTKM